MGCTRAFHLLTVVTEGYWSRFRGGKKTFRVISAAIICIVTANPAGSASATQETNPLPILRGAEKELVELTETLGRSVVTVTGWKNVSQSPGASTEENTAPRLKPVVRASGFVVSVDGDIVTNEHVFRAPCDLLTVTLWTGKEYPAHLLGSDVRTDLAVLKINVGNLPAVRLGDIDQTRRGQLVLAMGNPFGLAVDGRAAVSLGIVSAVGQHVPNFDQADRYYGNLIATTAQIHVGNSGGPLFNIDGEVIGVNTIISATEIVGSQQIAFAVPIGKWTKQVVAMLREGKVIEYGYLGVSLDSLPGREGASVERVLSGTPAEHAGILPKDIVLEYDAERVKNADDLIGMIGLTPPGRRIIVKIERGEKTFEVALSLASRKDFIRLLPGAVTQPQPERSSESK